MVACSFSYSLFTTLSNYKYSNLRNLQYNVATHTFYSTPTVAYTTYNTRQYNSILTPLLLDTTIATITTKYHCYYFYGIAIHMLFSTNIDITTSSKLQLQLA